MCSFLSISKKAETSIGLGLAVIFVLSITAPANWADMAWPAYLVALKDTGYHLSQIEVAAIAEAANVNVAVVKKKEFDASSVEVQCYSACHDGPYEVLFLQGSGRHTHYERMWPAHAIDTITQQIAQEREEEKAKPATANTSTSSSLPSILIIL